MWRTKVYLRNYGFTDLRIYLILGNNILLGTNDSVLRHPAPHRHPELDSGSPRGLATYTVRRLTLSMTKEGHQRELVPKSILLPKYKIPDEKFQNMAEPALSVAPVAGQIMKI